MYARAALPSAVLVASLAGCVGGADTPDIFPEIRQFSASPPVVLVGDTTTLSWEVQHAMTVSIPGLFEGRLEPKGSVATPPLTETRTFTLVASSEVGTVERNLVVTAQNGGEVTIDEFRADPPIISAGVTELIWATSNALGVDIRTEDGTLLQEQAVLAGRLAVSPRVSTTYVLTAIGPGGPKTATAQVLVGEQAVIERFEASPAQVAPGGTARLSWRAFNAVQLVLRDAGGQDVATDLPLEGSQTVQPSQTTAYSLVATGAVGNQVRMVTVEVASVDQPRIAQFDVTPNQLAAAGDVQVAWSTDNAEQVELRADGQRVEGFEGQASGQQTLRVEATTRFELRAENGAGGTSETRIVEVGAIDNSPPTLRHVPVSDGVPEGRPADLMVLVDDDRSGVAGVTCFYRRSGEANFRTLALSPDGPGRYRGSLPGAVMLPPAIEYYLLATDGAPRANASTDPSGAPAQLHRFTVQPSDLTPPSITHTPLTMERPEGSDVLISAQVTDATGVATVALFYKLRSEALFDSIPMALAAGGAYEAVIPGTAVLPPGVDYYIEASDLRTPPNLAVEPAMAPSVVHGFSVRPRDSSPPAVAHTPIANGQPAGGAVTVTADVTDATGVGRVVLHFRRPGGAWQMVAMTGAGSTWVAQIPVAAVQAPGTDYYLEVEDTALPVNRGFVPAGAPSTPYTFTVTPLDSAPPTISHAELFDGQRSLGALTVSTDVSDTSGVGSVTLQYRASGQASFQSVSMSSATAPTWTASIPSSSLTAGTTIEYYFEAVDRAPRMNRATLPATAPGALLDFLVGVEESEPNNTAAAATPILVTRTREIVVGEIRGTTDRDWFRFDVPTGRHQTVRFAVTTGGPGVCTNDTRIYLYDSSGSRVLIQDDSDGVNSCSLIDPRTDSAARGLAPGRYYLAIEEDGRNRLVPSYQIDASRTDTQCGNRILENSVGEQCDDGNIQSGDGCSATCRLEPVHTFVGVGGQQTGALSPAGDSDLYAVTVRAGDNLVAEVSNGSGGCPGDALLDLIRPDGITLAGSDDNDGPGLCPRVDARRDVFARALAAGTYFLRVRGKSSSTVLSSYTLTVSVMPNICGNNTVETGEQCDDGNTTAHDGCSSTCQFETRGTAMGTGASFMDAISPVGNRDFFRVVVPAGHAVRAQTFAPTSPGCATGVDTVLRFYGSDRRTVLASDDDGGASLCSLLSPAGSSALRNLAAGDYYVAVEEFGNNGTISAYTLDIAIEAPRCGDGFLGGNETCDDGNTRPGDGCSAMCQLEGNAESEPNNGRSTADILLSGAAREATVAGTLTGNDEDWYRIQVPANHHVLAEIIGADGSCPVATELRLWDPTGSFSRAYDDEDGAGDCPRLSPGLNPNTGSGTRSLPAGTYYLEVQQDAPRSGSSTPYQLHVRVLTPGCGDLFLDSGEQCDDGNTQSGDGCSSTCQTDRSEAEPNENRSQGTVLTSSTSSGMVAGQISPSTDVDVYLIDVAAGQSVEAAVHIGAIDQCRGGFDSDLELVDPGGVRVWFNDRGQRYDTGSCSFIESTSALNLSAGRYELRVGRNSGSNFTYVMSWTLR